MSGCISVVIPTLNEEEGLGAVLERLAEEPGLELIVADGGSVDRTVEVARGLGARVIVSTGGRARQLNEGARRSAGEVFLFLHADTRLPDGFGTSVREVLARPGTAAGAFRLEIGGSGWGLRVIEAAANWRSRYLQTPYGDQAIFLTREVFLEAGGFPNLPIMEDFALVRKLRRQGKIRLAAQSAVTSARRWERLGVVRTTLVNWAMVGGYLAGVDPVRLARWYRGAPANLTSQISNLE